MGETSGFRFPFSLDPGTGRIHMTQTNQDIREAVVLILRTEKGERLMQPEFGTRLGRFAFEQIDNTTRNMIRQEIISALLEWEDRVENITVDFEEQARDGILIAWVGYRVKESGVQGRVDIRLAQK